MRISRRIVFAGAVLAFLGYADPALASCPGTNGVISTTLTITATTTWDCSPIVANATVRVNTGGTLNISPGVKLELNGQLTQLSVNGGVLHVNGTSSSPVTITSLQDANGNGAPAQWYDIQITNSPASGQSTIDWAEIRFGGYGSSASAYGEIYLQTGGNLAITHSHLSRSQTSGVVVNNFNSFVQISKSRLDHNGGNGLSVSSGSSSYGAAVVSDTYIDHNTNYGVWINLSGTPTQRTVIHNNDIQWNGAAGVSLQVDSGTPAGSAPTGTHNNIFQNGALNSDGYTNAQLSALYNRPDDDWTNNYWGKWSGGAVTDSICPTTPAGWFNHHLAYGPQMPAGGWLAQGGGVLSPRGPVSFTNRVVDSHAPGTYCGNDKVKDSPYSATPFEMDNAEDLTSTEQQNSAQSVNPYFYFDEHESWSPLDVAALFNERLDASGTVPAHAFDYAGGVDPLYLLSTEQLVAPDGSFVDDATALPSGQVHLWWNGTGSATSPDVQAGRCTPAWSALDECGDASRSAMYYNLTTAEGKDYPGIFRSYFDYWVYYRWNDAPDGSSFDHMGDWEGMTVVTNAATAGSTPDVLYVNMAQHTGTYRHLPGTYDMVGGHPVGYPADGTHATYGSKCDSSDFPYTPCTNDNNLPEGDHDGNVTSWVGNTCSACIQAFPELSSSPLVPPAGNEADWNAPVVRWGDWGGTFAEPPENPGSQARYLNPWSASGDPPPVPSYSAIKTASTQAIIGNEASCASWWGDDIMALMCSHQKALAAIAHGKFGGRHRGTVHLQASGYQAGLPPRGLPS